MLDVVAYTEAQARALVGVFPGHVRRLVVLSSADVYRNCDGLRGRASAPPDFRYQPVTDTSRFRIKLGFNEPVGLREALARTVVWERG